MLTDPDESGPVIHEATHHGIRFMFRVKLVSGEEGERLTIEQTRAIRELLVWVRQSRVARQADPEPITERARPTQPVKPDVNNG